MTTKLYKLALAVVIFFLAALVSSDTSYARGTYTCVNTIGGGRCRASQIECEDGYIAGDCGTSCEIGSEHECIKDPTTQEDLNTCIADTEECSGGVSCQVDRGYPLGVKNYCCSNQASCESMQDNDGHGVNVITPGEGESGYVAQRVGPRLKSGEFGACIDTILGCFPVKPSEVVRWVLRFGISIGGGLAFLFMGIGAFMFMTSQGNPEQINQGKEFIVSALAGLLFIIFSVYLLRLIGVTILRIPGLG